jgi:photosystem II stability/assembly factor-like uncharacterized protein
MNSKFIFIYSLPLLISLPINAQEGWFWQNPLPTGNSLNEICFIDIDIGWAVGAGGTILKTTDGGYGWTVQRSGTLAGLNSVSFANSNNGLIAGSDELF